MSGSTTREQRREAALFATLTTLAAALTAAALTALVAL